MRVIYAVEDRPEMALAGVGLGVAPLVAAGIQALTGLFASGQASAQSLLAFQREQEEAERRARRTRATVIGLAVGGTLLVGLAVAVVAAKKK